MPGTRITAGGRRRAGDPKRHRCRHARSILVLALLLGWLGQAWSLHLHLPEAPERHHTALALAEGGGGDAHSCGSTGRSGDARHEGLAEHLHCLLCRSSRDWRDTFAATAAHHHDPAAASPGSRLARPGHQAPSEAPLLTANASRAPPPLSRPRV